MAHHYTEAGLKEQAIGYWQRAGQRALERSANEEAITDLSKGIALLHTLPETLQRSQQALTLYLTLGPALMATKGYAAPEVERVYTQARSLCQQIGETPDLFPALVGLSTFYLIRGDFHTARELGTQLLTLAEREQDPALLVEAHYILGTTLFHLGELASARKHLEEGITLYEPGQHRFLALRYGQDPGVFCLCYMVRILWFLGYPDQALRQSREAIALAREISHPFSLAVALTFAALVSQLRREAEATQERAEETVTLCAEQGFAFYLAMATILKSWALTVQGYGTQEITYMRQGLTAWQATGAELFRPHLLVLLAEAHGAIEQPGEGLNVLGEAMDAAHKSGKRFHEAELYRLEVELTLQHQGKVQSLQSKVPSTPHPTPSTQTEADAEACFLRAIAIARQQSAKSWELRAVMSLSRLWQRQGKIAAARQLLAETYGWFIEGFETADLQEAKTLLAELEQ